MSAFEEIGEDIEEVQYNLDCVADMWHNNRKTVGRTVRHVLPIVTGDTPAVTIRANVASVRMPEV